MGAVLGMGVALLAGAGCGASEEAELREELEAAGVEADAAHAAALAIEEQLSPEMAAAAERGFFSSLAREPLEPDLDGDERIKALRDRLDRIRKAVPFLEAQRGRMLGILERRRAEREAWEQRAK